MKTYNEHLQWKPAIKPYIPNLQWTQNLNSKPKLKNLQSQASINTPMETCIQNLQSKPTIKPKPKVKTCNQNLQSQPTYNQHVQSRPDINA